MHARVLSGITCQGPIAMNVTVYTSQTFSDSVGLIVFKLVLLPAILHKLNEVQK